MTEIKCDLISREYIESIVRAEFVDLQDGTEEWRTYVNDTCENILTKVHNAPTVEPFTQLEKEEIVDAITYLLDAELLEENGYTEEVINALKSALKKVGGAE